MEDDDYEMIFKLIVIGDSGVGKTNLLSKYLKDEFNSETKSTVGVEFYTKAFEINNHRVKAQIWDTAGQERYKSITKAYYKGAKGAIILYDITNQQTFENVDYWIGSLRSSADKDIHIILVGNKSDLSDQREVNIQQAEDKAKNNNIAVFETSALNGHNVHKVFESVVSGKFWDLIQLDIVDKLQPSLTEMENDTATQENFHNVRTISQSPNKIKKGCC